jgi:NAD(P)-dependent dehydrogenase (short-subunit alcohol dehydrogenase family)
MEFKNKTVVITGGAKGIGKACAKAFYDEGANVAILDVEVNDQAYSDFRQIYQKCDVSQATDVKVAMNAVYERFGSIHFLINNAGIQRYGSVSETTVEDWDLVMNVNLKSCFLCSKYAIPFIKANGGGTIINISSVQAFVTQEKVAAYAASKSAILGLTRSIAIDTPMLRNALSLSPDPDLVMQECEDMHLVKRIGKPEEVAAVVKFLCSEQASFITGQAIRVDGGLGITIQGSKKS